MHFRNLFQLVMFITLISLIVCCSTTDSNYFLVSASQDKKPDWIPHIPDEDNEFIYFVGLSSENVASEKKAKSEAIADSRTQVIQYYGTDIKHKIETINSIIGQSSEILDATIVSKEFEKQVSNNIAKFVHTKEVYSEKWKIGSKYGWKVYTLCSVPKIIAKNDMKLFLLQKYSEEQINKINNIFNNN